MNRRMGSGNWLWMAALAPAALGMLAGSAQASVTLPPRKPGFWLTTMHMEMSMVMNGKTYNDPGLTPTISAMCANAATDAYEMQAITGMNRCTPFNLQRVGSTYQYAMSCANPAGAGTPISIQGTLTPEGDEAFTMSTTSSASNMSSHTTGDSKWLGACPSGVEPGDFGTYINGVFAKRGNMLTNLRPAP